MHWVQLLATGWVVVAALWGRRLEAHRRPGPIIKVERDGCVTILATMVSLTGGGPRWRTTPDHQLQQRPAHAQGMVLFAAFFVVMANLLAYAALDPGVRYG
jgi:hypothetical protein